MMGRLTALALCACALGSCDRLLAFGQGLGDRGREAGSLDIPARPTDHQTTTDGARLFDGNAGDARADTTPVTAQWVKVWGDTAAIAHAVSMSGGWIYVVGQYEGSLKVDSLPTLPADGADGFVARVGRSGVGAEAVGIRTANGDAAQSVLAIGGAADEVWVGGRLGGGYPVAGASYTGLFLFRVDAGSLAPVEAAPLSGGGCPTCGVWALAPSKGGIAVAGTWLGTIKLGAAWTTLPTLSGVVKVRWLPAQNTWEGAPIAPSGAAWSGRAVAGDAGPTFYVGVDVGMDSYLWAEDPPDQTYKKQYSPIKLGGLVLDGPHLYLVGTLQGTHFGPTGSLTSQGSDIFILKLEAATGNELWSAQIGGAGDEEALAVAASGGRLYIAGRFGTGSDLGNGTVSPGGDRDGFVLCYDLQGSKTLWSVPFGGPGALDEARAVAADAQQVVVAGVVSGDGVVNLVGGPHAFQAASAGSSILFSRPP